MIRIICSTLALVCASSAPAGATTLHQKVEHRYALVKHRLGPRAPGRNIAALGVRFRWVSGDGQRSHWATRPATDQELAVHARQLLRLLHPAPRLLVRTAVPPAQQPAGALTPSARAPAGGTLAAIRACESGGNYATNTGNGFYGAYQFTLSTWRSVGGSGNPAAASPAEQDRRAAMLHAREGAAPWPVCGR